jgi:hypothetical protein
MSLKKENIKVVATKFVAVSLIALLVCTALAISAQPEQEKGTKADAQQLKTVCYNNETTGARPWYINNTGVKGYIVYWTTKSHVAPTATHPVIFRGSDAGTGGESKYSGTVTASQVWYLMENAYSDLAPTGGWLYESQATFIYENATGYIGWTYTKNSGKNDPQNLDRVYLVKIPAPTATVSGSNINAEWSAVTMKLQSEQDPNTDITDINAQLKGYTVWRSTTNATWNDNSSVGPVRGNISDWQRVSGPVPISGTSWTDTTVEVGKTYYYSLKLAFNGTCPVETMWGSLGSNPVTITDISPPIITHTPITSAFISTQIPITATISDSSGIKEAKLWYKGVNDSEYTIKMKNETNPTIYSGVIPAQATEGTVKYYINATDNYNNSNQTQIYHITISATTGGVSGRVINSTNETEGIANANVTVFNDFFSKSNLTNATGYFNITNIPPGDYTIKATKQYYWRDWRFVKVEAGKTTENVVLALYYDPVPPIIDLNTAKPPNGSVITDCTPTISINYTDEPWGEKGIDEASIVLKINDKVAIPITKTNKSIIYKPSLVAPLEDGDYTVKIYIEDKAGNARSASWSFTIITKGSLAGWVKDYYGNAIESAVIELLNTTSVVTTTITDSNGSYQLFNITKGFYSIRAKAESYTFKSRTVLIEPLQTVYVNFTAEVVRNDIFGFVFDEEQKPLVGVEVVAESPFYTAHSYTNLSGYYIISGLPVGTYNITAQKSGYKTETRINMELTSERSRNEDFILVRTTEAAPPIPSKPAFIPDVSIIATITALCVVAGIKAVKRKKNR